MVYPVGRTIRILLWLTATIISALLTIAILHLLPAQQEEESPLPLPLSYAIPAEVLCRIAATPKEEIPEAVDSDSPQLRLREYAPGHYELLYWGNPVRPHYTYSITKVSTGKTILYSPDGMPEQQRDLAVTQARRTDGKLPLQPIIKLHGMAQNTEQYYAAKISIHDGTTGKILCSEVYLINNGNN